LGRRVGLLLSRGAMATLAASVLIWAGATGAALPLRLIMVEEKGCRFCMRWNAEVGSVYAHTREGRLAPLERVSRDAPALGAYAPVIYTPTFIVARGGQEVGRITGYPGQSYFWEELAQILEPLELEQETKPN
jgi:hypothetical protein